MSEAPMCVLMMCTASTSPLLVFWREQWLPPPHTHTHTHTHTHKHKQTHMYTYTHTHTHTNINKLTCTHTQKHKQTHMCTHTHTHKMCLPSQHSLVHSLIYIHTIHAYSHPLSHHVPSIFGLESTTMTLKSMPALVCASTRACFTMEELGGAR